MLTCLSYSLCEIDFCAGGDSKSPDASVLQILDASGFEKDEITYEALHLYTSVSLPQSVLSDSVVHVLLT